MMMYFVTDQKELSDEVERLRRITRTALLEAAEDSHATCHLPEEPDNGQGGVKYPENKVIAGEESASHPLMREESCETADAEAQWPPHGDAVIQPESHLQSADVNSDSPEHHLQLMSEYHPQSHLQSADGSSDSPDQYLALVSVHHDPEELVLIESMPANKQPSSFKLKRKKLSEFMFLYLRFYINTLCTYL
jgi:hypothetical protein